MQCIYMYVCIYIYIYIYIYIGPIHIYIYIEPTYSHFHQLPGLTIKVNFFDGSNCHIMSTIHTLQNLNINKENV